MERTGKDTGIACFLTQHMAAVLAYGGHDAYAAIVFALHQQRVFIDRDGDVISRLGNGADVPDADPFPVPDGPFLELEPFLGGIDCRRHGKAVLQFDIGFIQLIQYPAQVIRQNHVRQGVCDIIRHVYPR